MPKCVAELGDIGCATKRTDVHAGEQEFPGVRRGGIKREMPRREGEATGAGWRGRLSERPLHPMIPLGSVTRSGFVQQEPILHRNQGFPQTLSSPRPPPQTLSRRQFDICLYCKLGIGIPGPKEGRDR